MTDFCSLWIATANNGLQYVPSSFYKFCELQGIQHIKIAPYSPRSNGKVKKLIQKYNSAHTTKGIQKAVPYSWFLSHGLIFAF